MTALLEFEIPYSVLDFMVAHSPRKANRPNRDWDHFTRVRSFAARATAQAIGGVRLRRIHHHRCRHSRLPRLDLFAVVGRRGPDGGRSGEGERAQAAGCGCATRPLTRAAKGKGACRRVPAVGGEEVETGGI
jgi:hypothetical protein